MRWAHARLTGLRPKTTCPRWRGSWRRRSARARWGFPPRRSVTHARPDGGPVASRVADWRELAHLTAVMGRLNAGVLQLGPRYLQRRRPARVPGGAGPYLDGYRPAGHVRRRRDRAGRQAEPLQYQMDWMDRVSEGGGRAYGQGTTRSINAIFSLKAYLPFDALPGWKALRQRPVEEQKAGFRDPGLRARLVAEEASMKPRGTGFQGGGAATTDPRKPDYTNLFPDVRRQMGRAEHRRDRPAAVLPPGRGDDGPHAGERGPGVRATADEQPARRCAGPAAAPPDARHLLGFRRPCLPRRWAPRCKPTC